MSFEPREYLRHILAETEYLIEQSHGRTLEDFRGDETLQRAFIRSLEVIGEAVKKLPADFIAQYPQIEWRLIAGMRDRLIHGYFSVDHGLVWDVVQQRVPELRGQIQGILRTGI